MTYFIIPPYVLHNTLGNLLKTSVFRALPIFFSDAILDSSGRIVSIFPRGDKKKPDAFPLNKISPMLEIAQYFIYTRASFKNSGIVFRDASSAKLITSFCLSLYIIMT